MSDLVVRLGNTAPTNSVLRKTSKKESEAAGPLGRRDVAEDGSDVFYVLDRARTAAKAGITTFVVPHGYSKVNAARDIGLAYGGQHSLEAPEWVHCDDEVAAALIADHLGSLHSAEIPLLGAKDLSSLLRDPEPGEIAGGAIQAVGRDLWAQALGDTSSDAGTSTGVTSTTLTDSGKAWTTNAWAGKQVITGGVIATVLSNTATVLTVARWETPGSRGGSAASTPSTAGYVIASGQNPALWIACTANSSAPSTGGSDTTLTGEITTVGSGFLRAAATYGHTTGVASYTLTITFTATGSDTFPTNINKIGVFQAQNGGRLTFETLLSATFTANQSGDNVQVTDTVAGT